MEKKDKLKKEVRQGMERTRKVACFEFEKTASTYVMKIGPFTIRKASPL
jgi:hypothetical protein